MADALDSDRRKALFSDMNRDEFAARVDTARRLTAGQRIEAAIALNAVAFDLANEIARSREARPA